MKIHKTVFLLVVLAFIVLASILLVEIYNVNSLVLPYEVGVPVTPASQLPLGMTLKTFDVQPDEPTPSISFDINEDSMNSWEVRVTTTNFTFTPEHINGAPIPGEGHVHLYIDNHLIIMLGPWYHIHALSPGVHTIKVGLFNNDHSVYSVNGTYMETSRTIDVK